MKRSRFFGQWLAGILATFAILAGVGAAQAYSSSGFVSTDTSVGNPSLTCLLEVKQISPGEYTRHWVTTGAKAGIRLYPPSKLEHDGVIPREGRDTFKLDGWVWVFLNAYDTKPVVDSNKAVCDGWLGTKPVSNSSIGGGGPGPGGGHECLPADSDECQPPCDETDTCPPPPTCEYGGTYPECNPPPCDENGRECPPPPNCEYGGTYPECNPPPVCEYGGSYPECNPPPCEVTDTCPPPTCEELNNCPEPCEYGGTPGDCNPPPTCEYGGTYPDDCNGPPAEECDEGYHHPNENSNACVPDNCNNGVGNGPDCQPPGDPPVNDCEGTSPGDPGNQTGECEEEEDNDCPPGQSPNPGGVCKPDDD